MVHSIIAGALQAFLTHQLQTSGPARHFFRLDGFDEETYQSLLELFCTTGDTLAGQQLWVRTTAPIQGYTQYALEPNRSATWYRNHVPPRYALVLIFNCHTSDAQSLRDIYPVTENLLATEGLDYLITAAFRNYQLSSTQITILKNFLARLCQNLFQPQLRDLVTFLSALNTYLAQNPGTQIETAIAETLPYLNLFRCRELANILNTPRGDRLLRDVYRASRLGGELLEEGQLRAYLDRLDQAEFDDDQPDGGLSTEEKRELLREFLTDVLANRETLLHILQIDWREVAPILHRRTHRTRREQLQELANELQTALEAQQIERERLPPELQDVLQDLIAGRNPGLDGLENLLNEYGNILPKTLKNKLRRLRGAKKHESSDFILSVTHLAVEMLSALSREFLEDATLQVTFDQRQFETISAKEAEAFLAFRTLYGGIERMMSTIDWQLEPLWELVRQHANRVGEEEIEEEGEREKVVKVKLVFRVSVIDEERNQLDHADLTWHYRSDGPTSVTLAQLQAEATRLSSQDTVPLRIPIYNTCPPSEEVGDLDLSRPIASLGAWYREATDLGAALREELAPRARVEAWAVVEETLIQLERAWACFVDDTLQNGALASDLDSLLTAYHNLLEAAISHLQQEREAVFGFRILTQAWIVGPSTFDEWAVVPFLHPLKLHWWRERARQFYTFIARLLDLSNQRPIVEERRFRRELDITYSSAGYPAVLALPNRERRADYFLPVQEVEGYELFRRLEQANLSYGLDPELVTADESERAAQISARELSRVVLDYLETYPFVRDGLEIHLVQCRNGALPGLLVEQLDRLIRRQRRELRLNIIVHTTDRGAPLYRRVIEWLKTHEEFIERSAATYFPPVILKVVECDYEDLIREVEDTDIVILPDVLAERGQTIQAITIPRPLETPSLVGYLPVHRIQQMPFERGELTRDILITPLSQPDLLQQFYTLQWAARERRAVPSNNAVEVRLRVSLQDWERLMVDLHERFNWVVCYDITVDRFLLEDTFPGTVEVIRYSLGLGTKHRHNLTISSSHRAHDIVVQRLTANLQTLLPSTPHEFRRQVARRLVEEANHVSGDIVLRAAGPGAYLNELIGIVIAKHLTEHRYLEQHPGALIAWIYLDDFAHWFDRRIPDLLFVAIPPEANEQLRLHIELLETKCIGETSFAREAAEAQQQVAQGINRLTQAWAPGKVHLDAPYWYDQLYRAVVGNLAVHRDQMYLWEAFRRHLPDGNFTLEISGHTWVFCYDGSAGGIDQAEEGTATVVAPDVPGIPHHYHHFGRAGVRELLRNLIEEEWQFRAPADTWSATYDAAPLPTTAIPETGNMSQTEAQEATSALSEVKVTSDITPTNTTVTAAMDDLLADWQEQKANELMRTLRNYGIQVYPIEPDKIDVGPSVIRFKLRLRPGERINRLQNIAADLQRELALETIPLIENVRGTYYVGVDLPHPHPVPIPLRPVLAELPQASIGELPFLVGKTPDGQTVSDNLAVLPHLLVAGSTGSGKTLFLYTLIVSLVHQFGPEAFSLLLIDPKQTDFVYFEGLPYLLNGQVVIEPQEAIIQLERLMGEELLNRTQQLRDARSRDIRDYNASHPQVLMKPIIVVIDEYADLVQVLDRNQRQTFEQQLVRLAQRARNVGIHLVIATQRPTADIVTSNLKTNLPARIAFRLPSHHDSMTILDRTGAENLFGRGDMLFRAGGRCERLQGFYLSTAELEAFLHNHIRNSDIDS